MSVRLQVVEGPAALAAAAASEFLRLASDAIARHGAFRVALAGGETPRSAYERIADTWSTAPRGPLDWDRVHFFWSDERMVPADDRRSNLGMAQAALISRVPARVGQIYPIPIDAADAAASAAHYEKTLRTAFAHAPRTFPRFDLVLLGMGADGHTASLFPGAPSLGETRRLAVAAGQPETGEPRVTLTLPVINHAAATVAIVAGHEKAAALDRAVRGKGRREGEALLPVERLQPAMGTLLWIADEEAAPWARADRTGRNT